MRIKGLGLSVGKVMEIPGEEIVDVEHVASTVADMSNLLVDTNAQTVSNCKAERFRLDERLERWSISTPTTSFDSL